MSEHESPDKRSPSRRSERIMQRVTSRPQGDESCPTQSNKTSSSKTVDQIPSTVNLTKVKRILQKKQFTFAKKVTPDQETAPPKRTHEAAFEQSASRSKGSDGEDSHEYQHAEVGRPAKRLRRVTSLTVPGQKLKLNLYAGNYDASLLSQNRLHTSSRGVASALGANAEHVTQPHLQADEPISTQGVKDDQDAVNRSNDNVPDGARSAPRTVRRPKRKLKDSSSEPGNEMSTATPDIKSQQPTTKALEQESGWYSQYNETRTQPSAHDSVQGTSEPNKKKVKTEASTSRSTGRVSSSSSRSRRSLRSTILPPAEASDDQELKGRLQYAISQGRTAHDIATDDNDAARELSKIVEADDARRKKEKQKKQKEKEKQKKEVLRSRTRYTAANSNVGGNVSQQYGTDALTSEDDEEFEEAEKPELFSLNGLNDNRRHSGSLPDEERQEVLLAQHVVRTFNWQESGPTGIDRVNSYVFEQQDRPMDRHLLEHDFQKMVSNEPFAKQVENIGPILGPYRDSAKQGQPVRKVKLCDSKHNGPMKGSRTISQYAKNAEKFRETMVESFERSSIGRKSIEPSNPAGDTEAANALLTFKEASPSPPAAAEAGYFVQISSRLHPEAEAEKEKENAEMAEGLENAMQQKKSREQEDTKRARKLGNKDNTEILNVHKDAAEQLGIHRGEIIGKKRRHELNAEIQKDAIVQLQSKIRPVHIKYGQSYAEQITDETTELLIAANEELSHYQHDFDELMAEHDKQMSSQKATIDKVHGRNMFDVLQEKNDALEAKDQQIVNLKAQSAVGYFKAVKVDELLAAEETITEQAAEIDLLRKQMEELRNGRNESSKLPSTQSQRKAAMKADQQFWNQQTILKPMNDRASTQKIQKRRTRVAMKYGRMHGKVDLRIVKENGELFVDEDEWRPILAGSGSRHIIFG